MKFVLAVLLALSVSVAWAAEKSAPPPALTVKGKVLEVKDVDSYTYLRLQTKDGETWAAVTKTPITRGADVTIENAMVMSNFESKALKRKFDRIVFGSIAGAPGSKAPAGSDLSTHSGMAKAADVENVKVAKATAPDARTVAEIITKSAQLKDRKVTVRGKVVKYTPAVLGKNWIHLRDGTGSAADQTHDVLVTTKDTAKIGDIVIAKGVVHTDKDLGSGYTYKVLIEEATLQK
jgi:DNA/RNA endonuclease YhcR with UshA esterase domain